MTFHGGVTHCSLSLCVYVCVVTCPRRVAQLEEENKIAKLSAERATKECHDALTAYERIMFKDVRFNEVAAKADRLEQENASLSKQVRQWATAPQRVPHAWSLMYTFRSAALCSEPAAANQHCCANCGAERIEGEHG